MVFWQSFKGNSIEEGYSFQYMGVKELDIHIQRTNFNLYRFKKKIYLFIYLFLEGREEERETNINVWLPLTPSLTPRDLAYNPGVCPDWESNRRPFGSQAGTQFTELHQPGLKLYLIPYTKINSKWII